MADSPHVAGHDEVEVKSVVHYGWRVTVLVVDAEGGAGVRGAAVLTREGATRCRLTASDVFDSREQAVAVLVAKADKWIAVQTSSSGR